MGDIIHFFYRRPGSNVVRQLKKEMPNLIDIREFDKDMKKLDAEIVYSVVLLLDHFRPSAKDNIFQIVRKDVSLKQIFQGKVDLFYAALLAINEYWRIPYLKSKIDIQSLFLQYHDISDIYGHILKHIFISNDTWKHLSWDKHKQKEDELYTNDGTGKMLLRCYLRKKRIELWIHNVSLFQTYETSEKAKRTYERILKLDVDHALHYIDITFTSDEINDI
jgi:hypothetical protein